MNQSENQRKLISLEETARILDIAPRTIRNQTGRRAQRKFPIPFVRIGRLIKFDICDVYDYIDKQRELNK